MLQEAPPAPRGAPHVIVVGNEKGGSGKTTIAMHVAIALMKEGQRVSTIDLDGVQKSFTRYIENRRTWANYRGLDLEIPTHRYVSRAEGAKPPQSEAEEYAAFEGVIAGIDESDDFLVIDTPASDTFLMRLAHQMADTVLTPVQDSFLDLGTLGSFDPITRELVGVGHYAALVSDARHRRRQVDRALIDWVVIRNRFSLTRLIDRSLGNLGTRLAFRDVEGCAERVVYRQFFACGLTALDPLEEAALGERPTRSHVAAQEEMRDLITILKLPTNDRSRRRAAARAEWVAVADTPLEVHEFLADESA